MKDIAINKKYIIAVAIIIILFLITITIIITSLTSGNRQPPTAENTQNPNPAISQTHPRVPESFHDFTPQKTTKDTIIDTIGRPKQIINKNGYSIEFFPIKGTNNNHTFILKDNKIQYIIEATLKAEPLYEQFIVQTGKKEDGILYNIYNNKKGFNLYVFAAEGKAFVHHPEANQTVEVHYFPPSTYNTYLQNSNLFLTHIYDP